MERDEEVFYADTWVFLFLRRYISSCLREMSYLGLLETCVANRGRPALDLLEYIPQWCTWVRNMNSTH